MPYGKGTYGSKVGRPKKKKTKVKDALYRGKLKKGPRKIQKPKLPKLKKKKK